MAATKYMTAEDHFIRGQAIAESRLRKSEAHMRAVIAQRFKGSILVKGAYTGLRNTWHLYCVTHDVHFYRHGGFLRTGAGCEKCCEDQLLRKMRANAVRKGNVRFTAKFKEKFGDKYTLVDPFVTERTKIRFNCDEHGEYLNSPEVAIRRYGGCQKCGHRARSNQSRCITPAQFVAKLSEVNPNIEAVGEYVNKTTRIAFRCTLDNYEWTTTPDSVLAGHGCKFCDVRNHRMVGRPKAKEYTLGKKVISVQGYEPQALDLLLTRYKATQLIVGKEVPVFIYDAGERTRRYFPDIFIPSENRIVEVKSTYTLFGSERTFSTVKKKRDAVILAGYKFNLMLMTENGSRIKLPDNWHDLGLEALKITL